MDTSKNELSLQLEQGTLNVKAAAIILHEGKLLVKKRDGIFVLPRGNVQFNESAEDALERILRIQLTANATVGRCLFVHQRFCDGEDQKPCHQLTFYFLTELSRQFWDREFFDGQQAAFCLLSAEDLKDRSAFPPFVTQCLKELPETTQVVTTRTSSKSFVQRLVAAAKQSRLISTSRLALVPMQKEDAPQVFQWTSDSQVVRYLRYDKYDKVEDVEKWIESKRADEHLFGIFLKDGTLVGCANASPAEEGRYELGYSLNRTFWQHGYCTEACLALIAYTAEKFGAEDFHLSHAKENVRSQRVAEKCGFRFEKNGSYTTFDGSKTFQSREYGLKVTLHKMNLENESFLKVAEGTKSVELRLNDEKRRRVHAGDLIAFTDRLTGRKAVVKVTAMHIFDSFDKLYGSMDLARCGYFGESMFHASSNDMLKYYSKEKQRDYGVVGIEFTLLATF